MAAGLTPTDYAFLIILRAEGREISNKDMDARYGVRLVSPEYVELNNKGYVESDTTSRPYRHTITKQGRKLLAEPMVLEEDGERRTLKEKILWAALVAQQRAESSVGRTAGASAAEPEPETGDETEPASLEDRIREAYWRMAGKPGAWVNLTDLRVHFHDVSKSELDKALIALLDANDVRLEPEPFGHRVGKAERGAAVHVGGEDRHKMAIGVR